MNILPTARTSEIILSELQDELLIYDLSINKAFCLNKTSAIVYKECNGLTTFTALHLKYSFTDDLIFLALDELKKANLLTDETPYISPFNNMSRRETLRRVGFATLIALPLISSVVAPTAANAASGGLGLGNLGAVCVSPADCAPFTSFCISNFHDILKHCCANPVGTLIKLDRINHCEVIDNPAVCNPANFSCQANADSFCCSGSASASCTPTRCQCLCD